MGEKLLKYYQYVKDKKGILGKVRLAKETKITSILAASEPDSPENIRLFKEAVERITEEPAPDF